MAQVSSVSPRRPQRSQVRPIHRILGTVSVAFVLFVAVTGVMIQVLDLRTLSTHAPGTDPDMMAIRESLEGPPNFEVIAPTDYEAPALPAGYDIPDALARVLQAVRSSGVGSAPLQFLELRVVDGRPLGVVREGDATLHIDPLTGAQWPSPPVRARNGPPAPSIRNSAKRWHRLQGLGQWLGIGDWMNLWSVLVGFIVIGMLVTGLTLYVQLWRARRRAGRRAMFWSGGGRWLFLHRAVAVVAALFLLLIAVSGTLLGIDSLSLAIYKAIEPPSELMFGQLPRGMFVDASTPLPDARVPGMVSSTLTAYHAAQGETPIKALRLRYFAGMPQGVVISGGTDTRQWVFNAATGARVGASGPGYPYTGFPFGWQEHELMKRIHRGDALGIPGRVMDLLAGLSLIFLAASGFINYLRLRAVRRASGRTALFWS